MKARTCFVLVVSAALAFALGVPARAADSPSEEQALNAASSSLDQTASQDEGKKAVITRLETTFGVDQARIDGLRAQSLGYGEIAIVLALSQKMDGGITDANIQTIMAMRTGTPPLGWGEIANKLGEKLGAIVSEVNRVAKESHDTAGKAERAAKGERPAKPDKPARPDHPDKPGKP
jgi:hypothetical protein